MEADLALRYARAQGTLQRPVADHVPVGRGQVVEVVNVEFLSDVAAQVLDLLWERGTVGSAQPVRADLQPQPRRQGPSARPTS